MDFDAHKTVLLEKKYLYVRATKGFQIEGTSTFRLPVQTGYYRFFVDNLQRAIGNAYVTISYYLDDFSFYVSCDDTYMDEVQSSPVVAVESLEGVVSSGFSDIKNNQLSLSENLSGALQAINTNLADMGGQLHSDNQNADSFLSSIVSELERVEGKQDVLKSVQDDIKASIGENLGSGLSDALQAINTNLTTILIRQESLLDWPLKFLRASSNLAFVDSYFRRATMTLPLAFYNLKSGSSRSYMLFGPDSTSPVKVTPDIPVYYCVYSLDGSVVKAGFCPANSADIDIATGFKLVVVRF